MAERLSAYAIGGDFGFGRGAVAQLQQGDQAKTPTKQLQRPVSEPPGALDDVARVIRPDLAVLRCRQGIAERCQRVRLCAVVVGSLGKTQCLVRQLQATLFRLDRRRRYR